MSLFSVQSTFLFLLAFLKPDKWRRKEGEGDRYGSSTDRQWWVMPEMEKNDNIKLFSWVSCYCYSLLLIAFDCIGQKEVKKKKKTREWRWFISKSDRCFSFLFTIGRYRTVRNFFFTNLTSRINHHLLIDECPFSILWQSVSKRVTLTKRRRWISAL